MSLAAGAENAIVASLRSVTATTVDVDGSLIHCDSVYHTKGIVTLGCGTCCQEQIAAAQVQHSMVARMVNEGGVASKQLLSCARQPCNTHNHCGDHTEHAWRMQSSWELKLVDSNVCTGLLGVLQALRDVSMVVSVSVLTTQMAK
jgi:hypothetical protein